MLRVVVTLLAVGGLGAGWLAAVGQAAAGATNTPAGFTLPYRKDGRLVARFTGDRQEIISPTLYRIFGFKVETFNSDGTPSLLGEAPECVLNVGTQSVSSAGRLTVSQPGGAFVHTGVGFSWDHESGRLRVSNEVRTVIRLNPFSASPVTVP